MLTLFPPASWTSGIQKESVMSKESSSQESLSQEPSSQESSGRDARRFVRPLPAHPNLDKQRKLAKALARDYWRGRSEAIERVRALHPKPPAPETFVLSDARLVIARGYGFA